MKKIATLTLPFLLLALVGCETTAYRKSAGGQTSHKSVKVYIGKDVEIAGNVVIDLDESQSNTGTSEQGGAAQGAVSPEGSLNGNSVSPTPVD